MKLGELKENDVGSKTHTPYDLHHMTKPDLHHMTKLRLVINTTKRKSNETESISSSAFNK